MPEPKRKVIIEIDGDSVVVVQAEYETRAEFRKIIDAIVSYYNENPVA